MFDKLTSIQHRTKFRAAPQGLRRAVKSSAAIAPAAWRWGLLTLFAGLVTVVAALGERGATYAATDKLPDLGMAVFKDLQIDETSAYRRLRFGARIINIGSGPFEARGSRPDTQTSDMAVVQRIYDTAGGFRDIPTASTMYYSGDGHDHWHIRKLQTYEVIRLDTNAKVEGVKGGFCFWDSSEYNLTLAGAPPTVVYSKDIAPQVCAKKDPSALQAFMGLSVGWADLYGPNLPDQYVDLTGLPAGKYRLRGTSDKANWYLELNEDNNCTWTDLQIQASGTALTILGASGDAVSCSTTPQPTPPPRSFRVFVPLLFK